MSNKTTFNLFADKTWQEKVLDGDKIWAQIRDALAVQKMELPTTLRRPDLRLIVKNTSGATLTFHNPGNHSGGAAEVIPASGEATAVMIMLKGDTLAQQHISAQVLFKGFDLASKGLTQEFIDQMASGALTDFIDEAYGPAPFDAQVSKLTTVDWAQDGNSETYRVAPAIGDAAAFGARAATQEKVFIASLRLAIKGTNTTPEMIEGGTIAIAIDTDWQTGQERTRPIATSVARSYYGAHFDNIPVASVHPDGSVRDLQLSQQPAPRAKTAHKPAK